MDDAKRNRLAIVIVGHVDHGKSTLVGRLLHDTGSLPDGKIEQVRAACDAEGMEFEHAFLLDALLEEQEQNITIDTTRIPFRTATRDYVIIDAPGHKEFLKNMVTGAAGAQAALLLIDAREGICEQSRRHAFLLSFLGLRDVIVVVNKMDLVDGSREVFERLRDGMSEFLGRFGLVPRAVVPASARQGTNIVSHGFDWFDGPHVLGALEALPEPATADGLPLRFTLQDVYRFDERRLLAGRVDAGTLRVGDELVFWPDRKRSRVKSIEVWGKSPETARAGESIALTLEEQIFVERGQIASHPHAGPAEGREIHASLFWLSTTPLALDQAFELRLGTQCVEARVVRIAKAIDSASLDPLSGERTAIHRNEVAEVFLRSRRPIAFDRHDRVGVCGRFVAVVEGRIGGGGIILEADEVAETAAVASDNITWTVSPVTRESRADFFGHRGAVVWLTGLSGSGKSTLAVALESQLHRAGIAGFVLDGDNLRHGLCSDLRFSAADRSENIRRAGETAKLMAEAGLVVVCSLISPFRADRLRVREICHRDGIPFIEVFVNAPLEVCEARDPRGLYKRARAGEIKDFTGLTSPYEAPETPELEIRTGECSVEEARGTLFTFVRDRVSDRR